MSDSKIQFRIKESDRSSLVSGNDGIFAKLGRGYDIKDKENSTLYKDKGIATKAKPNIAYEVASASAAKELFGEGSELYKSCLLHFVLGGAPLHCVMPENNIPSKVVSEASTRKGTAVLEIKEKTNIQKDGQYTIKIITAGGFKKAKYVYSNSDYAIEDEKKIWSAIKMISSNSIKINDIELSVNGADGDNLFVEGDIFKFTVTGRTYDMTKALDALEDLKENNNIRVIHVVGPTEAGFWSDFNNVLITMAQNKRWVRGIVNMSNKSDTEKDYTDRLKTAAQTFYSKNIAVFYNYVKSQTLKESVSAANHALATLSKAKVQESIGWTGAFPQEDVVEIENWDDLKLYHNTLTKMGFNSLYHEDGEAAGKFPFFGIGLLKAPPKSDFRKISSGRVMDKALRVIHSAIFPFLRANQGSSKLIAGSKAGILNLKLKMEAALDGMMGRDEINGYEINIPAIDDPNMTVADLANLIIKGELEGTFKLYENSHIESMLFDAMYAMPKLN